MPLCQVEIWSVFRPLPNQSAPSKVVKKEEEEEEEEMLLRLTFSTDAADVAGLSGVFTSEGKPRRAHGSFAQRELFYSRTPSPTLAHLMLHGVTAVTALLRLHPVKIGQSSN